MSECAVCVSIVVPTKDRYETLFDCIHGLLLNYDRDDVEIVVRDNSMKPRIDDFLARFSDRRNVVYEHDPAPVSQSENCELSVKLARGDFVTLIGDDDGVAGGLVEIARWMELRDVDAFVSEPSVYLWPGVSSRFSSSNTDGWLSIRALSPPCVVGAALQRAPVLACGSTSLLKLPRLYHGLVRRSCLAELRAKLGTCFPGPSPDMANAFALSYVMGRMAVAELPVFISGNSSKSNAGLGLRGKHVGEIAEMPFLPKDTTARWNPRIPYFWSGQTIWCQSAYAAADALGHGREFDAANDYRALHARLLVFHARFAKRTLRAFRALHAPSSVLRKGFEGAATILTACRLFVDRVAGFAKRQLATRGAPAVTGTATSGVPSVVEATGRVDAVMRGIDLASWLDLSQQGVNQPAGSLKSVPQSAVKEAAP